MTHIGKEIRLCFIGCICHLLQFFQLLIRLVMLRDIYEPYKFSLYIFLLQRLISDLINTGQYF